MKIYKKNEIEKALDPLAIMEELERGLVLYSENKVYSPPVGFCHFENPEGDVHIKSAAIKQGDHYVIKVASGFYENPNIGLSSSNGLLLLFSLKTGVLDAILLDEGILTNIRTALVGAICAKYLAPKIVNCIGVIGTGTQAKLQLIYLKDICKCRNVMVWGRNREKAEQYKKDPRLEDFNITIASSVEELASKCNLIITTTSSKKPLLLASQINPNTHITALGTDDATKQELDPLLFTIADTIIADSRDQCFTFGDLSHAKDLVNTNKVVELGEFIKYSRKRKEKGISIADLTGLGIEDLQTAKFIYKRLENAIHN